MSDDESAGSDGSGTSDVRESRADRLRRRRSAQRERVEGTADASPADGETHGNDEAREESGDDGRGGDERDNDSDARVGGDAGVDVAVDTGVAIEDDADVAIEGDADVDDDGDGDSGADSQDRTRIGGSGDATGVADPTTDERRAPGATEESADAPSADGSAPAASADGATPATSVKEEQVGTYMYLPQRQKKDVERRYTVLKAEYEYEFDRDFEKNRHFFPLLVEHGLRELEDADATDVREMLRSLDR